MGPIRILALAQSLYGKGSSTLGWVCSSLFLSDSINSHFFNSYVSLCRILGMRATPHGGSPCLRMWRGVRPIMSTTKGGRHRGKGGSLGAPLGRLRGRKGRKLPPSPNPWEMTMWRWMKTRKRGEITPSRQSLPPKDFPSLGDLFSQQVGISVGVCRTKHPRAGTGRSSG
jgi:hypothetical protein